MSIENDLNEEKGNGVLDSVIHRSFGVEKHNGKLFIFTSNWNDDGENIWTGTSVTETELRRIVNGMQKFL